MSQLPHPAYPLRPADWYARYEQQARWTLDLRRHLLGGGRLTQARRVLDVGCGAGALLPELLQSGPQLVTGLDLDDAALVFARRSSPAAALVSGDALHLPFATASFELSLCHFVLLWLSDPARALREMRRVTRSGGWVLALAEPDYGGRLDYPPELESLGRLQAQALARQGAEVLMGRRLRALFHQAGLINVQAGLMGGEWRGVHAAGEIAGEQAALRADLASQDELAPAELERLLKADALAWENGERILFVPTFYACGQVA